VNGTQIVLLRPELDSWNNNQLFARAVMAVAPPGAADQYRYGVVWLKARTETDIQGRLVTLSDLVVTNANFPSNKDKEAQYQSMLQRVAAGKRMVVSLDHLEAVLAAANWKPPQEVRVNNAPPEIILSYTPSVLVHVDGAPVWRPSGIAGVERAINTKALLLRHQGRFYLGYAGHWASSAAIAKGWAPAASVPAPLLHIMAASEEGNQAPAQKDLPLNLAGAFNGGKFPAIYVRTDAAELISINGMPKFNAIPGTRLSYVGNTAADVFIDGTDKHNWYILVSGRWFSAPSAKGPWRHMASSALPADFVHIPQDSPKGAVLASMAGTPEAREAVIANSIPQTATVDRSLIHLDVRYDGEPQFRPIPGMKKLSYAIDTDVALIRLPGQSYYALSNGIWFVSEASPQGPWVVATSVPGEIYAIPPSSPLHYVTYARVYGSSGRYVHVGYTLGYYGALVSDGTVVYGTGYSCAGWVGKRWYGCPETYGYGAALAYGAAVGWSVAFGWGWDYPWYNPAWGPWDGNYPGYYPWAYGGAAAWNGFGRWGEEMVAPTRAAWANPWTSHYGAAGFYNPYTGTRGYGYAGHNLNSYRGRVEANGLRYDPQSGRAIGEAGAWSGNPYAGREAVSGMHSGAFVRSDQTADSRGRGVTQISANMYPGRDGNVYRESDYGWERFGSDNRFSPILPTADLERERSAMERAFEREAAVSSFERNGGFKIGRSRGADKLQDDISSRSGSEAKNGRR
jgi:hypothetical protein